MNQLIKIALATLCFSISFWLLVQVKHQLFENFENPRPNLSEIIGEDTQPISIKPNNAKFKPTQLPTKDVSTLAITIKQSTAQLKALLATEEFTSAIDYFNQIYDELNQDDVKTLKGLFYQTTQSLMQQNLYDKAETLMRNYLNFIQDQQAYLLLAKILIKQTRFPEAIDSTINAHGFAFDGNEQTTIEALTINTVIQFSNTPKHQKNDSNDDVLSNLLKVHYLFPENEPLILEIAKRYYDNNQIDQSLGYLNSLTYSDSQYGEASRALIATINKQAASEQQAPFPNNHAMPPTHSGASSNNERIVALADQRYSIPLKRSGSSYLVDTVINNSPVTLLLDTGASITALSVQTIKRLSVKKTARRIRLATANGTTTSAIYRVDSLRMENIELQGVSIAEIDLGRKATIDGLLGTDVLQRFNYQINAESQSLILKPR